MILYREEQEQLANKLAAIEKKIIVGGENLLEKAEEQERMLQASAKELDERKAKEEELRRQLEEKEQVRLDIEEKYSNLQEEVAGKTKKLKKVWTMLMQAKSEVSNARDTGSVQILPGISILIPKKYYLPSFSCASLYDNCMILLAKILLLFMS